MVRVALVALMSPALAAAPGDPSLAAAEPLKPGTFEIDGDQRIGIVLRDKLVVDLNAAPRAFERNPASPAVPMPGTMVDLIGRYEYGMKTRRRLGVVFRRTPAAIYPWGRGPVLGR